ncbi:MAG TPA: ABC transporter permease [Puia sp.]|nr:ABC transporter permease [Puia sp.]
MFKNYFKIAWRNLLRNKISSFINIGGLAMGMSVAILIGLWIYDELSFNKYHQNYDHITQVMTRQKAGMNTSLPFDIFYERYRRKNVATDSPKTVGPIFKKKSYD